MITHTIEEKTIATQANGGVPAVPDDPYTAFGEANAVGDTFLKFDRGVYRFGPADASEVLPLGTLLVVNMPEMKVGWLKWQDGEVAATDMRRLADGFYVTPREELGDMDEAMWEMGNDDLPKDPWSLTTLLPLKDPTRLGRRFMLNIRNLKEQFALDQPVMARASGRRCTFTTN